MRRPLKVWGLLERDPDQHLQYARITKGAGARLREAPEAADLGAAQTAAALCGIVDGYPRLIADRPRKRASTIRRNEMIETLMAQLPKQ